MYITNIEHIYIYFYKKEKVGDLSMVGQVLTKRMKNTRVDKKNMKKEHRNSRVHKEQAFVTL